MKKTCDIRGGPAFRRSRFVFACLMIITIISGLASRSKTLPLPGFFAEYGGDTLWAVLIFLILGFVMPAWRTWLIALVAALFSVSVEISQLYHAPWIDAIRQTRPGALVLGHGFLWSDILCYGTGIAVAASIEVLWNRNFASSKQAEPAR